MFERRSLRLPVTLGVVMIVLVVVMIVGWILTIVYSMLATQGNAALFWILLGVGTLLLAIVLVGVVVYLTLTVKAVHLSQRQSNFIDSVTHELKSPIASLKLCLQTIGRAPLSAEQLADIQQYMLEDVERLDQLINHLLDAARTARTVQPPPVEQLRLDELIRECVQAVCLRYGASSDIVRLDVPPCTVHGVPEDLTIMLRNLIDNAVKYAGDDPRVRISAAQAGQELVVVIEDNGRGIPTHLRRQVFGRFVRLGRELERDRPGTGLGLFIVRSLAQRTRCRIRVRDGNEGIGTAFEITLPRSMKPAVMEAASAPADEAYAEQLTEP